jgi:hypothetical protein
MKPHSLTTYSAATTLALLSGLFIAFCQIPAHSADVPKKGVTPYVTHFIFRPVETLDISGLGTATLLEAVGTTQNMKGERRAARRSASTQGRRNISTVPACSLMQTAT